MKFLLLSALIAVTLSKALTFSKNDNAHWERFKATYKKNYGFEEEEQRRKLVFMDNLKFVREHNEQFDKGNVTFKVNINKFADMTLHEFSAVMKGFKNPKEYNGTGEVFRYSNPINLPSEIDWRKKGAVTAVKDQGDCEACWAFSAVGSVEGQHKLKTGRLVSLSAQNLVDCTGGINGCNGGFMNSAFDYIKNNKGIDTEESYRYDFKKQNCRYNPKNNAATITGYVNIPTGSEKALQLAVSRVGPVSVGIDSNHPSFQLYSGGIYVNVGCSSTKLDHAVLAVGYGRSDVHIGGEYWLMKNSWGTDWGIDGYLMIARNRGNMCGIATKSSYPRV